MRSAGRAAVQATALAAVGVLAVGGGVRLLTDEEDAPASAARATGGAVPVSDEAPGLTARAPTLELAGDELELAVPVRNGESEAALVQALTGLPTGMRAVLPASGLRVPAEGEAVLSLRWSGPDCTAPLPERMVGDLTWEGSPGGTLAGGTVDEVARSVWLDVCAGRPSEGGVPREDEG